MTFPDDPKNDPAGGAHDALFDEFGPVPEAPQAPAAALELPQPHPAEARAEALEKELKELKEWAMRLAADFDNFKKRAERDRHDHARFSTERLLKEFLPIMDNLQRALDAAVRAGDSPAIAAGVELVISEMMKLLRRAGVEPIVAEVGQPFDPAFHEALQQVETDTVPAGSIALEVQRGYSLHGRILRPALVTVASSPEVTSPGMERSDLE